MVGKKRKKKKEGGESTIALTETQIYIYPVILSLNLLLCFKKKNRKEEKVQ
jgi:hypothetical protein